MTSTVSLFLGLLTLLAAVLDMGVLGLALAVRLAPGGAARGLLAGLAELFGPFAVLLAAIVAVTAMSGSLFYSEVARFVPCELCWFQRIAMYASAVILVVAVTRREEAVRPYALTLAGLGLLVSAYHVLLQRFPDIPSTSCSLDAPCTAIWVNTFGFITIPVMAGVAFATIVIALLLPGLAREETDHAE